MAEDKIIGGGGAALIPPTTTKLEGKKITVIFSIFRGKTPRCFRSIFLT